MSNHTVIPGNYKHYKGKHYQVIGTGRHTETLEEFVVYRALYTSEDFGADAMWVRPISMFLEEIELNGIKQKRFVKV